MTFHRGKWRCGGDICQDDAAISVMVVVSTPGKQRERVKHGSKTVRLCMACARVVAAGIPSKQLKAAVSNVMQKVTGERWDMPKAQPRRK